VKAMVRTIVARLHEGCRLALRAALLQALVLFAFRVAFLVRYAPPGARLPLPDLARALLMGARFDLKVGAVLAIPVVVLGAAWAGRWGRQVLAAWLVLAGFGAAVAAMVNDGFFGFYHTPIDPIVFGLFEDDTGAVFRSLWEEHRIVLGPLSALLLGALQAWLALRPPRRARSFPAQAAWAVALPLLLFLAARGRLGGFPLSALDYSVSTEPLLNAAVPDGPMALVTALSERRLAQPMDGDPRGALRRGGFQTPAQAAALLGLAPAGASDDEVAAALFTRSRENPAAAARPPHVVLVVMESWGADALRYHSEKLDLLGRLAPHLGRGLLFRRFTSSQNGTDPSLEAVLVNSPVTPLLSGAAGLVPFEEAAARPFQAAGYHTVFAIGWSATWRGMARSFPSQGFDEVADVADVLSVVPDAPVGTWGAPDAALFRWAADRLARADARGERLLLVLMTATNHSPYAVPAGYAVRPLDLSALAGRELGDRRVVRPQLETYQYACDALGGFLDDVAARGLSPRTIVAATGDHNTRELFQYTRAEDLPWRDRVPFFLQVPAEYLAGRAPDLDRWAAHRDIFPTLEGLALSGARVFRSGEDLLSPPTRTPRALARFQTVLTDEGAIPQLGAPGVLCAGPGGALAPPAPGAACQERLEAMRREEQAYLGLLDWDIRRQAVRRARGGTSAPGTPGGPGR
jgi:hypothetical protein